MDGGRIVTADWTRDLGLDAEGAAAMRRTLGHDGRERFEEDPYVLASPGFGGRFEIADGVAMGLRIELDDPMRVRAGLLEAMRAATSSQGHCVLPTADLVERTALLLGLPVEAIVPVLDELDGSSLVRTTYRGAEAYAPSALYRAEIGIAARIKRMAGCVPPWRVRDAKAAMTAADRFTGKPLKPSQRAAFEGVLASKVSVITGGPGVGKTTLLKAVLHAVRSAGARPRLGAPTGRAAMNMIDATGLTADTLHIMLGRDPKDGGFLHRPGNTLDCDLVVMDESSMTDVLLAWAVISAMPAHAALILIGDVDQLEPVGPGRAFADIIASGVVPVFRLTEILRQAAGSKIITNCHRINAGEQPELSTDPSASDFLFFRTRLEADAADRIVDLASRGLPGLLGIDATRDVQVLSPMNVRDLGTEHLQPMLQEAINADRGASVAGRWAAFSVGDKVLHTRNNYVIGVRNGEIGVVTAVDPRRGAVGVDYSGRTVVYDRESLGELKLGYAVSVHKSQGSEYPAVVMPVVNGHGFMLTRRLLLTACSRGKRMVALVGHVDALARAVANTRRDDRFTRLRELLEAA